MTLSLRDRPGVDHPARRNLLPPGPRISGVWQLVRYTPAPLTFLEKYASLIAVALGLLSVLLIAWYSRYRPTVPPSLRWAVAHRDSPSGPAPA